MLIQRGDGLKKAIWLVLLCAGMSACSFAQKRQELAFIVKVPESTLIRFEGKGAAAGVMMSSSMGPMGIAIGAAIDEGIAKDIRSALDHVDCKLEHVVGGSFETVSRQHSVAVMPALDSGSDADILIHVDRVTFRVQPSERDLTLAEVSLRMEKSGVSRELASAYLSDDAGKLIPLEEIRADGGKACELLRELVSRVFEVWYQGQ